MRIQVRMPELSSDAVDGFGVNTMPVDALAP